MLKINKNLAKKIVCLCILIPFLNGCVAVVAGSAATGVAVAAQDKRTTGTIWEDKAIQLKAIQRIHEIALDDQLIQVTPVSYNNQVLLVGQVPSRNVRAEIEDEVRSIEKVRQVHNEITIQEPLSMKQHSIDSWMTTRIKSEMAVTKHFNATHVKVVTVNSVVYLMGIVTPSEEEIAVDIARHVNGVDKVVKIFEYVNS